METIVGYKFNGNTFIGDGFHGENLVLEELTYMYVFQMRPCCHMRSKHLKPVSYLFGDSYLWIKENEIYGEVIRSVSSTKTKGEYVIVLIIN